MPTSPRHVVILALLLLVCAASPSAAKTVHIDLTAGEIFMSALDSFPFSDANVNLAADGFALTVDKFNANFQFAGTNPGLFRLPSGSIVDFSGGLPLDVTSSFTAFVSFDGVLYGAEGNVTLKLDPVTVAAQIVQPFTLTGKIDGDNLAGGKDQEIQIKLPGSGHDGAAHVFRGDRSDARNEAVESRPSLDLRLLTPAALELPDGEAPPVKSVRMKLGSSSQLELVLDVIGRNRNVAERAWPVGSATAPDTHVVIDRQSAEFELLARFGSQRLPVVVAVHATVPVSSRTPGHAIAARGLDAEQ
jgi:hypothetical protein